MNKTISLALLTSALLFICFSCYDPDDDVIEDRYCSFYRPDYATIDIQLGYKYFDNAPPVQTAIIKIFNWSPDGKLIVNDLDGGILLINGQATEFKDSLDGEGFYLKNKNFKIVPGNRYTITFDHDTTTYEFETSIPKEFDDFKIPEALNMASDLCLQLNTAANHYNETTIFLAAYAPVGRSDSLLLINNEVYKGDSISIPFKLMASSLYGWDAELCIRRAWQGSYDYRFLDDSKITGTCSYYKKFGLTYSKAN